MRQFWSRDPNELWEQMLRLPVSNLQEPKLSEEVNYWLQELVDISGQISGPFKSGLLRFSKWGGSAITLAGLPAIFAALPVGIALSVGGIATLIAGHIGAKFKKGRDDDLKIRFNLITGRLKEIEEVRAARRS